MNAPPLWDRMDAAPGNKVKSRISRKIKIPLTRSGRQRKIGKLLGIR